MVGQMVVGRGGGGGRKVSYRGSWPTAHGGEGRGWQRGGTQRETEEREDRTEINRRTEKGERREERKGKKKKGR